jgi:hypothetical protein
MIKQRYTGYNVKISNSFVTHTINFRLKYHIPFMDWFYAATSKK